VGTTPSVFLTSIHTQMTADTRQLIPISVCATLLKRPGRLHGLQQRKGSKRLSNGV
jgi:hypothetical protein